MRLLYWLVTLVVMFVAAAFAVANRQDVSMSLWPFFEPALVPLYFVMGLALLVGLFLGIMIAWAWSLSARRAARARARRIEGLERELAEAHQRLRPTAPVVIPHS
ncbi:MAG TPA: lipopolysaccharide assembly protein LapA domain-containing protein [Stellaceae bacterium]|nr:lipopolysaccharide assembly protein LapA domain-containing protein [Stellaceae bacterium]